MNQLIIVIFLFMLSSRSVSSAEPDLYVLKSTEEMYRAEVYLWDSSKDVDAIFVFCPGHNGVGKKFVQKKEWQDYASKYNLALCGLSFASEMQLTKRGKGYSYAARGSGKLLLDLIDRVYLKKKLPIYLYGYSAGARFVTSFVAWKPQRVLSWCASGVGTWPKLPNVRDNIPHGVVACGEYDAACYWSSLNYFQRGRKQGYPWSWLSLAELGHGYSDELDVFVKMHLLSRLSNIDQIDEGDYYDLDTKKLLTRAQVNSFPEFAVWLSKDKKISQLWQKLHHP